MTTTDFADSRRNWNKQMTTQAAIPSGTAPLDATAPFASERVQVWDPLVRMGGLPDFWGDVLKGIHEVLADTVLALIVLHLAGVALSMPVASGKPDQLDDHRIQTEKSLMSSGQHRQNHQAAGTHS